MDEYYWVSVYPDYGNDRSFQTNRLINEVIAEHETLGDYVIVKNSDGDVVYRSAGLDFLNIE